MKVTLAQKLIICLFAVVIFITVEVSCRKLDTRNSSHESIDYSTKFFNVPENTDPVVKIIAQKIKRLNDSAAFVDKFSKRVGFPVWNKALVASSSGDQSVTTTRKISEPDTTIMYIPFDQDSIIDATLIVKIHDNDTAFKLLNDYDYKKFSFDTTNTISWNARDVFNIFAHFENTVFGRTVFKILDHRLVPQADSTRPVLAKMKGDSNHLRTNRTSFYAIPISCETWEHCYGTAEDYENECESDCTSDCPLWLYSSLDCTYLFYTLGETAGGMSLFWTDGDGNQTANSAGWEPVDFEENFLLGYSQRGYEHLETWTVSIPDEAKAETFKTENIDTTGLDSCRIKILKKLLGGVNGNNVLGKILGKMERSIYATNNLEKFKWKFHIQNLGSTVTANTDTTAYNSGTGVFTATTTFDSAIAVNATDIYVAGTFLHEAIHAYMISILRRLKAGVTLAQLQAMTYDSLFNEYVDTLVAKNHTQLIATQVNAAYHHNLMADKLVNIIAEALKQFDDNSIGDDEYYWYMAWKGLYYTNAWQQHWPNYANTPIVGAPLTTEDSTRGLKYALTPTRIVAINAAIGHERTADTSARGRKPVTGGCY
jgi:hypothetical protein